MASESNGYISDDELWEDVRRVAEEKGGYVTTKEYDARGKYSSPTVSQRLGDGSWVEVLETLGYTPPQSKPYQSISREDLVEDVHRVASEHGGYVTQIEYNEHGKFSAHPVRVRLGDGSWPDALESLGYSPPATSHNDIPREELEADLIRVAEANGGYISVETYQSQGEYSAQTILHRLGDGSWIEALESVGVEQ